MNMAKCKYDPHSYIQRRTDHGRKAEVLRQVMVCIQQHTGRKILRSEDTGHQPCGKQRDLKLVAISS